MKVNVVGTSCTWFKRKNTSFVIDENIVFDMPEGSYKDVLEINEDIFKIKAVIITHMHSDHFMGFHVLATRFVREKPDNVPPLKVYCPEGTFDVLVESNKLFYGGGDECDKNAYGGKIEFVTLYDGMNFEVGEYNVTAYKVEHGEPETFGFTFTDKNGLTVGFSSDTEPCENLEKIICNSKHAFVELSSPAPRKKHLSISEYQSLMKKYKNTTFYPVHTCDECQEYVEKNKLNPLHDGQVLEF